MSGGFFQVHRSIFDHEAFSREPFTEREAFIWLVGEAAFKDHERVISGKRIYVKRGELAHSYRWLAERFKWSLGKLQRYTKRLKSIHMVGTRTDTGILVISICNYDRYQSELDAVDTVTDTLGDTPDPPKPIQNEKNGFLEELENPPPMVPPLPENGQKTKQKTQLPSNFPGTEDLEKAQKLWAKRGIEGIDAKQEADKFSAHHAARASKFVSWSAAWRTWYLNAAEFRSKSSPSSGGASKQAYLAAAAKLESKGVH